MQYLLKAANYYWLASVYKRLREFETKIKQDNEWRKSLMGIDKKFLDKFVNVTSKATLASSYLVKKRQNSSW